jgi:lactobin A/cerein 7B family class IIb bacteriocin
MNTFIQMLAEAPSPSGEIQELSLEDLEGVTGGVAPILLFAACLVVLALPAIADGTGASGPPVNSNGNGIRVDTNTRPTPSLAFPSPMTC